MDVKSQNQFRLAFNPSASKRLYQTTLKTYYKPFNMRERKQKEIAQIILNKVVNNCFLLDNECYELIHTELNKQFYRFYGAPMNESQGRADYRVLDIEKIIDGLGLSTNTYLDIGCSSGNITSGIGQMLNVPIDNRYGIDVVKPKQIRDRREFTFIQIEDENEQYPFEDDSFDVITILMVLHHLKNPEFVISEIKRILKYNGLVIVREHDLDGKTDTDGKIFLDMLHGFYSKVWALPGQQEDKDFTTNYFANYQTKETWTKLFFQAGFVQYSDTIYDSYYNMSDIKRDYSQYYKIQNPYHYYYAVYTKGS